MSDIGSIIGWNEALREVASLRIFRGLPHELFEKELFDAAIAQRDWVKIDGYHFHSQPIVPEEPIARDITLIASKGTSFAKFSGEKRCGGFHPDWGLIWELEGRKASLLICLHCVEAKLAWRRGTMTTRLRVDWQPTQLHKIMDHLAPFSSKDG